MLTTHLLSNQHKAFSINRGILSFSKEQNTYFMKIRLERIQLQQFNDISVCYRKYKKLTHKIILTFKKSLPITDFSLM